MAGLFEGIIDTLKEKRKEGKIQYGFRYNPDLKIGGGYYDDNKMFEVDVDRDGVNLMFKKKFAGGGLAEEYYGKDKLDWMENYSDQMTFEEYLRYKRSGSFANGGRIGFANGGDGDYIYTRPSGAKRLVIGDTIYGSVAKGDKKGLEALKKKRDKLVKTLNVRTKYDLEALKKEWRKTLPTKKATTWENFLKTKFPEGSKTPNSIRKKTETDFREGKSDFNPKEEFKNKVKQKQNLKKVEQAKKLVKEHNDSDKFLYDKKTVYEKLGFTDKIQVLKKEPSTGKVYKSLFNEAIVNEVNKLMPIEQKVKNAFDKIVNENLKIYEPKGGTTVKEGGVIKKMISDIVSPKGGLERYQVSSRLINNALNTHKPYLDMKNDFDYLDFRLARKMKGKTFNEAMDYAKYVRGGLDMKNIEKFSTNYRLPESNVIKFALRSAFNNYKAGNTDAPVRVFNLKADGTPGKEIDFAKLKIDYSTNMKAIDTNKIGFTYKNQFFTKDNLRTKGYQSGLFNEVYNLTQKGNNISVPDPKNPSKNITLNKLLQLNKDKLTLGHNDAKGGVTKLPFSDLRLEGNKINLALYNAYNKIKNKPLRKLVVNKLQGDFGYLKGDEYERAFIEGEQNKANNIAKKNITERTLYKQAGRDVITDLGKDILKQKQSFQKELFRVAGMSQKESAQLLKDISKVKQAANSRGVTFNSFAGFIDFSQAGIELPPAVKLAAARVARVGSQILKGTGAGALVLDPMFAAMDFSEAIDRGVGGKEAAKYTGKRFVEGVLNLPDLIVSGGDFLSNKIAGEDAKFETGKLYEPFTFAQEGLEEAVEKTPLSTRLRNIAERDFDVGQGAGMRMVDDTEIPASQAEINAAKEKFVESQMGPYYKYGIESMVEEEPEETPLQNQGIFSILAKPTYEGVL